MSSTRKHPRNALAGLGLGLLCLTAGVSHAATAPDEARPNIVIIMTDDQGLGDLGFMGNTLLDTPRTDALAAQSVRFDRFYVSAVCAPTRASLLTGRYNYRTRVVDTWVGRSMMETAEVTLAEMLGEAGYATSISGKWHLGDCYPMRPIDQGFDEALVHRGGGLAQPAEPPENERRYTDPILFHNGEQVETTGYCTDVYTDHAIESIERAVESDRPFFAYLAPNAPHDPYHDVPMDLYEKYEAMDLEPQIRVNPDRWLDDLARVYAMIENIDQNVGRLLDSLDRLGVAENTIVLYLHDNGPRIPHFNAGLQGRKTMPMEGGIRSPLLVRWPDRLDPNDTVARPAAHIDIVPTLLEACDLPIPADPPIDGRSLLPLLDDPGVDWAERLLFFQTHRADTPAPRAHFAVVGERYKLVRYTGFNTAVPDPDKPIWLFDLANDPGEGKNIASDEPEIFADLLAAYDAWFEDVSTTRPDNYDPPRIVIGTDYETETVLTHQDSRRPEQTDFTMARWQMEAAGTHRYTVRIMADDEAGGATVTLHAGDRTWTAPGVVGSKWIEFEGIEIPAGQFELWTSFTGESVAKGSYHVIVIRDG